MAESIPADVTTQGECKERENPGGNITEEKPSREPSKKDTVALHPQRETKREPQKSYGRRRFYNAEFYRHDTDNWIPDGREKVRRLYHPHRHHWQSWNEDDHGERETSRQYYHHDGHRSVDSLHHRRGGKRSGHKTSDSSKVALTQDGAKERKKKTVQQPANSVTDENGGKTAKEKPDVDKSEVVNKTEKHSTVKVSDQVINNSVINETEENVKRKPNVDSVVITEMGGQSTVELNDRTTNGSVTVKSQQKIKKKPDIEVTKAKTGKPEKDPTAVEVHKQSADNNSVMYTKRRDKKFKKRTDIDKGELTKTDRSTDKTATQRADNPQHEKDRDQNEPIPGTDKEKSMVIMVGKYQVKKFKPISKPNTGIAEDHSASGAPNSKVTSDKTANQTTSIHSHKKRIYHNKAMKGAGRHYGGVAASLQSDVLSQQLTTGQYECMVCCDRVRVKDPVWSCSTCYHVFHLKCIKKWAKIPTDLEAETRKDEGWRCPGCRTLSQIIPSVYKCFCGKMVDPVWTPSNKFQVPHSCGELCGKRLATDKSLACMHKCRLLCHPGPCPPCPVTVSTYCPCGKKPVQVRCSDTANVASCGSTCDKLLACGRHHCEELCHSGPCEKCDRPITIHCYCGKHSRESVCAEEQSDHYSCGKRCSRLLDCENHICERVCHDGTCDSCALLPDHVTHCPCGATSLDQLLTTSRTSCLDPIPTCNAVCRRLLPCSTSDDPHYCEDQCHLGECPVCDKQSVVTCKCGKSTETIPCRLINEKKHFECSRVCNKKLTCGRHRCSNKCCVRAEHSCDRVCGKRLQCGRHFCQDSCHSGHCERCWEISYEELSCQCGAEVLYPPIPCGTTPPVCSRPCSRLHPCDHPVTHTCHSEDHCPPCTFLTERMCMGGHGLRKNIPCHMVDVSCGLLCGKELPCSMHKCQRVCHKDACLSDGEVCQQPCINKRTLCDHMCAAPCHPDKPCPASKCKAMMTIKCPCSRKCTKVQCGVDEGHAFQSLKSEQLNNLMMELQSGHTVSIHDVTLSDAKDSHKLECDEICAQEERNRKLAEALKIENPDISSSDTNHQYSPFLLEQAKNDLKFILSIEEKLKTQVENTLKTNTVGQVTFSVMKANQRRVVHELAAHFMCDTYSVDPEPLRNVIAIVNKKSLVPSVMLSQAAQNKKIMPAPVKNIPREQPISTMVTLGKSKDLNTTTAQLDDSRKASSKSPVDYFADDVDFEHTD